jgi:hypothetical protein
VNRSGRGSLTIISKNALAEFVLFISAVVATSDLENLVPKGGAPKGHKNNSTELEIGIATGPLGFLILLSQWAGKKGLTLFVE